MAFDGRELQLYVITDRRWLRDQTLAEQVEKTVKAGATMIQLRDKGSLVQYLREEAIKIKQITNTYNIPLILNDNVELAKEINADGVHIGQTDMELKTVRKVLGNDKIIGVSARTVEQALAAQENGADYIGAGAVFGTSTKSDAKTISLKILKEICSQVNIPVVAIGGINEKNILQLKGTGVSGAAIISAIFAKEDITMATKAMLQLTDEIRKK